MGLIALIFSVVVAWLATTVAITRKNRIHRTGRLPAGGHTFKRSTAGAVRSSICSTSAMVFSVRLIKRYILSYTTIRMSTVSAASRARMGQTSFRRRQWQSASDR